MIGKQLSPILEEIENTLWEFEMRNFGNPQFTDEGFRAALKIFMSAILDKMWSMQDCDKMDQSDREKMAESCGNKIKELVFTYTGIDTHKLFEP